MVISKGAARIKAKAASIHSEGPRGSISLITRAAENFREVGNPSTPTSRRAKRSPMSQ